MMGVQRIKELVLLLIGLVYGIYVGKRISFPFHSFTNSRTSFFSEFPQPIKHKAIHIHIKDFISYFYLPKNLYLHFQNYLVHMPQNLSNYWHIHFSFQSISFKERIIFSISGNHLFHPKVEDDTKSIR